MSDNRRKRPFPRTARAAALVTLLDFDGGRFPEEGLEQYASDLDRRDRALASALVFGVLRWRTLLEWTWTQFLQKPGKKMDPAVAFILDLGLLQLQYMDRIPPSAAVNESVNLARTYAPAWSPNLVNGVLRALTRAEGLPDPASAPLPEAEKLALIHAHPLWLAERWLAELGPAEASGLLAANNRPAPLTLRADLNRISREELAARLSSAAEQVSLTPHSPAGLQLEGPTGPVPELPGFTEGLFTVQDEAAQVVSLLAQPRPGETVLDACAGRGGKTLHLAAMTAGGVWGLDPDGKRLALAGEERRRLGLKRVHLVQGDLLAGPPFPPESFDVVLVDAPCSNLGVIRRRPDVKHLKSAQDPARMAETQLALLKAAAGLVKPRGRLVYAVCTLTQEETTGVTDAFWMDHLEFGLRPAGGYLPESAQTLVDPDGVIRAWPHRHGTDGFFAAVFEKKPAKPADFPAEPATKPE